VTGILTYISFHVDVDNTRRFQTAAVSSIAISLYLNLLGGCPFKLECNLLRGILSKPFVLDFVIFSVSEISFN
jgi:hypothetical protein